MNKSTERGTSHGQRRRCNVLAQALITLGTFAGIVSGLALAQGNPGEVVFSSKIVSGQNFQGVLANGDLFGDEVAPLGDLDGDGVMDIAVGAPVETAMGTGAVWILFLNHDGSVKAHHRIPDAGFGSQLAPGDAFGESIVSLGDLDGDGSPEIAVGAKGDDESGADAGAIWILFLNSTGAVKTEPAPRKIIGSDCPGGLAPGDHMGEAIESIGDLDGDGTRELAVGVFTTDDEGLVDSGAVFVLFLDGDGAVKMNPPSRRISASSLDFTGPLSTGDYFGTAIADLGDLDGAGPAVTTIAVGAKRSDLVGLNTGAVWLLFLGADGVILSQRRIEDLDLQISTSSTFGSGLENLGDLNDDGVTDLCVAAQEDPDGGAAAGAIWMLFLDPSGVVVDSRKVSALSGHFDGPLGPGDHFGEGLANLGDLDGDGRLDLAVGARGDDDSGADQGAVWILSLNDGSIDLANSTTWIGSLGDHWNHSGGWTNDKPDSTKTAIIPAGDPPLVDRSAEACLHLVIQEGGSVLIDPDNDVFEIHGGATLFGPITGPPDKQVRFVGPGMLSGTSSISVPVEVDASLTVQGGPLTLESTLTKNGSVDLTIAPGAQLIVQGATSLPAGGTLSGSGTLDLNGPVTLAMDSGPAPLESPNLRLASSLSVDGTHFSPDSGRVTFDGGGPQVVTQMGGAIPLEFFELELAPGANVQFSQDLVVASDTLWDGNGSTTGSMTFSGEVTSTPGLDRSRSLTVPTMQADEDIFSLGDYFGPVAMVDPTGTLRVDTTGGTTVQLSEPVDGDIEFFGTGTATVTGGVLDVQGNLGLLDSSTVVFDGDVDLTAQQISIATSCAIDAEGNHVDVYGNPPISVLGDLRVAAGGALGLSACPVTVGSGGTLRVAGDEGVRAELREADATSGGFTVHVQGGGTLEAGQFLLQRAGAFGFKLDPTALLGVMPVDLRHGRFDFVHTAPGSLFLDIERTSAVELVDLRFDGGAPGSFNVRVPVSSSQVLLTEWSGSFGGPAFEPGVNEDLAEWSTQLAYFVVKEKASGNLLSWKTRRYGDLEKYVLERAPTPFVLPVEIDPDAAQVHLYQYLDPSPGMPFVYTLFERFPGGSLHELGALAVDGIPNPLAYPAPAPPAFLPLSSGEGPAAHGPASVSTTISEALARADDGRPVVLELEPGEYAAFENRGRSVRLLAPPEGEAWIDVSSGPVRITGLRSGQSVEFFGLRFSGASAGEPAVVIEDCDGLVWLDEVAAQDVRLSGASAVLLQQCQIDALRLDHGSMAFAAGGDLGALALSPGARLESWGLVERPEHDLVRGWSEHSVAPALRIVSSEDGVLEVELTSDAGAACRILAASTLGFRACAESLPLVLDPAGLVPLPGSRSIDSRGVARFRLDPGSSAGPLYLQALVLDPAADRPRLSSVLRIGAPR